MAWLYGIIGFIGGFAFGIFVIGLFLRGRPKRALMQDRSLRWTYGLAVWVFAGLGAWGAIKLFE